MQTPTFLKQSSGGIPSPEVIDQRLNAVVPSGTNNQQLVMQPFAKWLASVQSLLKGSDTLRHMQLDAIQNAQKRTSQLARSIAHSNGHLAVGKAWQQFSQDNLQNAVEYWTAYREILQDTKVRMLNHTEKSIGSTRVGIARDERQSGLSKPVKPTSAKSRKVRKIPVAR